MNSFFKIGVIKTVELSGLKAFSTAKRGYEIAKRFPKEKVIIGGAPVSLLPDEAL